MSQNKSHQHFYVSPLADRLVGWCANANFMTLILIDGIQWYFWVCVELAMPYNNKKKKQTIHIHINNQTKPIDAVVCYHSDIELKRESCAQRDLKHEQQQQ